RRDTLGADPGRASSALRESSDTGCLRNSPLASERSDVPPGDHDVVEPDLADVPGGGIRDVVQHPEEVELQPPVTAPAEPLERHAFCRDREGFRPPLRVVPADAIAAFAGDELVENPLAPGETLAEVADLLAIDPERHFAVRVAH